MQVILMYHHNINNCPMAVRDPHHPQSSPHPLPSTSLLFLHLQQPSMLRLARPLSFPFSQALPPSTEEYYNCLKKKVGEEREVKVHQSTSNVVLSALFPYRHVQITLMYVTFLPTVFFLLFFYSFDYFIFLISYFTSHITYHISHISYCIFHSSYFILHIFMLILILSSDHSEVFDTSSLMAASTALHISSLWPSPRARLAVNHRCTIVDPGLYKVSLFISPPSPSPPPPLPLLKPV